jgi:hypothetical protein
VLAPGEGRSIDLGAFAMTVKANSAETNGVFSLLEADEPPGFGPPLRLHDATSVAHLWYKHGMPRVRVSTTVDEQLLATARRTRSGLADSALIDEALVALLARNRAVEVDTAYTAYDRVPLDADDEWGDLASFRTAAGAP